MTHDVTLRASRPEDKPFLFRVYAGVRRDEMAPLGWSRAQEEAFFQMQFAARQHGYGLQFPTASCSIIQIGDLPVGSMHVAREADAIRLVDIALLQEFRGKGIGGRLIAELLAQGAVAGHAVRLSVVRGNRAASLYWRLGFQEIGEDAGGIYVEMEARPQRPAVASGSKR